MGNKLRVLMVQPELRWQSPSENLSQLDHLIASALQPGDSDLIVLPETFTTGFLGDVDHNSEGMDGPTIDWLHHKATQYDCAIAGSAVIVENGKRYNRFLFVSPAGQVSHYDKRHLFAYGGENTRYQPGNERLVVNFRGWRICPQICYDLRFPVWCRNRNDYDLLIFVANWPAPRVSAWSALLRARAIENQACVIGINRVGRDGHGVEYSGQSVAHDGMGNELLNLQEQVSTAVVELDLDELSQLREKFPFQADADAFSLS